MPFLIVAGLLYARAAAAPEVLCNLVTDYGIAIGPQDQTAGKPGTSSASYIATQTKPILHSYLTNALRFQPFKKKKRYLQKFVPPSRTAGSEPWR